MHYDVMIVGNGISGLSLAYELKKQEPNLKVVLIGPPSRRGAATTAAGAMINVYAEIPVGCFENSTLADRFEITRSGGELWSDFAAELKQYDNSLMGPIGKTIMLINSQSTKVEIDTFNYISNWLKNSSVDHKNLDVNKIDFLKPSPNCPIISALEIPDARIDPVKVLSALECAIKSMGVEYIHNEAVEISTNNGLFDKKVRSVTLADGVKLQGDKIVLANGAFAQKLVDQIPALKTETPRLLFGGGGALNAYIPDWVRQLGGLGKTLLEANHVIRTPDRGGSCGFHAVPHPEGRWYIGASSAQWLDPSYRVKLAGSHGLMHTAINEINREFFYCDIELVGNGFRPTAVDCFPLLGEANKTGIWFNNGMKRDGFTSAPYVARELTKEILGQRSKLPEKFKPCRALLSYKNKSDAIEATKDFYLGMDMQHGGGPNAPFLFENYMSSRFSNLEKVYQKRGIQNFGIHPEMFHLWENKEFYAKIKHKREMK